MSRVEAAEKVFFHRHKHTENKDNAGVIKGKKELHINLNGTELRQVENFQYLGIWINENVKFDADVRAGIARAKESFWRHKELLRNNLSLHLKKKLLKTQVWSVLRYGCETFSLTKSMKKKIFVFELWCYSRILKLSWQDFVSNESVLEQVHVTWAELPEKIIARKLAFFGHIARKSAGEELSRIIQEDLRKTGRGRRRRWWIDDVKEVTGCRDIRKCVQLAQKKKIWKLFSWNCPRSKIGQGKEEEANSSKEVSHE